MQRFDIKISLKSFESSTLQATKDKIQQFCHVFILLFREQAEGLVAMKKRQEKGTATKGQDDLLFFEKQGIIAQNPGDYNTSCKHPSSLKRRSWKPCVVNTTREETFSYQPLPSHTEKFTLLRSPHIDKKSREQFERHTYKGQIRLLLWNKRLLLLLLFLLKNSEFPGIELTITVIYSTPLYC